MSLKMIGKELQERRKRLGITQQDLAELAGVGRRVVIEAESGKGSVTSGRLARLCEIAGLQLTAESRPAEPGHHE